MQEVLAQFLERSGLRKGMQGAEAMRAWAEALGPAAERAQAVRFQDGELLVEVQSAPHFHELKNFTGEDYRRAANQRLGRETIRRVVFQQKR
jgi:hypothetical protein